MRNGMSKGRNNTTYQHKLDKIKKWHAKRVKDRELALKEGKNIKALKPLEFYVEKLKKPNKDR